MSDALRCGFLASEDTLDAFLSRFFDYSLPKAEWTHTAHLAMAASLLYDSEVDEVLPKVRQALWDYVEATGGRNADDCGYHETLTIFWLKVVSTGLREVHAKSRLEAAREIVAAYGDARRLHTQYYSFDLNSHATARRYWVEPDLRPMP